MLVVFIMHKKVAKNVEKYEKRWKNRGGRLFCRYDVSFFKI